MIAKSENLAVILEVATLDHPVLFQGHPILLLVAVVDFEAARVVFVAVCGGVGNTIRFEKSPDEVVCDGA